MIAGSFYHELIRKYTIIFGTLFNQIDIKRDDGNEFRVPLAYGPTEKYLSRLEGDPDIDREIAIQLPRLSFEITSMSYASERKLNTKHKVFNEIVINNTKRNVKEVYVPVPYDIKFDLNIISKTLEDGHRILEQILPYFTPDWTVSAKLLEDFDNIVHEVPIILESVAHLDSYQGDYNSRRSIIWTLSFNMKAVLYGRVDDARLIRFVKPTIWGGMTQEAGSSNIVIQPGLTADGNPTTYSSSFVVQATATSTIDNGKVNLINITNSGIGYSKADVTISAPTSGTRATAKAIIADDTVSQIVILNQGSGYTSAPTVTISAPNLASVDANTINYDDNYGYVVSVNEKYNFLDE